MFEQLATVNGVRVDLVNGRFHYVTTGFKGQSVIGPARHRHHKKTRTKAPKYIGSRLVTTEELVARSNEEGSLSPSLDKAVANLRTTLPPRPQRKRSRTRRLKDAVLMRFYDTDLHKAIQHTALDVIMVTAAVVAVGVAARILFWAWS